MPDKPDKPDSQPAGGTEDAGGGKSPLQTLLAEYEQATGGGEGASDNNATEIQTLKAQLAELTAANARESYRREMDDFMIPAVSANFDVRSKEVEAWLNEQADRDPRLLKIWENRENDRAAYETSVEALAKEFEKYAESEGIKPKDDKDTGDPAPKGGDKSAAAAVRSARQPASKAKADTDDDLAAMNDSDFALHKAEVFRVAKAGGYAQN